MNNIKKYRTNTPLLANATGDNSYLPDAWNNLPTSGSSSGGSSNESSDGGNNSSGGTKTKVPWWQIFDSVADTISGVFSNIVFPWMNGGTTEYTFYEAQQKKDETGKYVIIGVVIIVVVLILARMLKK